MTFLLMLHIIEIDKANKEVMWMMSSKLVAQAIEQFSPNELIVASKLYNEQLQDVVTEAAFYQTLKRMCGRGTLCRISKGTYYRPQKSKYGVVPLSQKEILAAFTEPDAGTIMGYALYNNLKLTTQIPKVIEAISSRLDCQTKTIGAVSLRFCELTYTPEIKNMVHMLDILQNFNEIQEFNYQRFMDFCVDFSNGYDDSLFEEVSYQIRYPKRTISFLKNILDYYGVQNHLEKHLSSLSKYEHPTMEEIYAVTQFS